jgi:membrane-associated progesterone receptor component
VDASQFKETYDDLADLTASQMESVKEWEMQFLGNSCFPIHFSVRFDFFIRAFITEKYPLVGKLLKPGEEPTNYQESGKSENNEESSGSTAANSKKEL